MAQTLVLDSEAVNALARATERGVLAERARAILRVAHERAALVRIPAPVLAEVCRGTAVDAPIHRLLQKRGMGVEPLTERIARRAGGLLARARLGSAHAVDAFVVATAFELGPTVVATGDPTDLARLAQSAPTLTILAL